MKRLLLLFGIFLTSCYQTKEEESLSLIQIQDRNGLTETISNPDRLVSYKESDFLSLQPYKKVLRIYKGEGKNSSIITTYHPNGILHQYLEAEEMRAKGAYREWFSSGKQKIEAEVIGGTADLSEEAQSDWLFDKVCKVWDEAGNLAAEIEYRLGALHGKSTYYYPEGEIQRTLCFEKDELFGPTIEYGKNGEVLSKTRFKKGLKHGESLGFFENGAVAWKELYEDGRLKEGTYYDLKGELLSEIEKGGGFQARYNDQKELTLIEHRIGIPDGLIKEINSKNETTRTFFIKNGKKNGEETTYYLNRKNLTPKLSVFWKDSTVHGTVKTWYENGQLESEREFCKNLKTGPSLSWYQDGSLMLFEEYEEDRLCQGQYYKIRGKEPVSHVINGSGTATLYDENGFFLKKVTYLNGKPVEREN